MTINYSKVLNQKLIETKLSTEALAKAIGVSSVSLRGILRGKSKPNAKTAQKYAKYLGVEVDTETPAKTKRTTGKLASSKKIKKGIRGKPAAVPKPARSTKKSTKPAQGLGAQLVEAVSAAAGILDDQIALAVHRAGAMERELIAHLLSIGQR